MNPQSLNRYSYVFNRPLVLRDPSGHELGPAFNYTLSPNTTQPDFGHGQGLIDLATEGIRVNGILISGADNSTSWLESYTRDFRGYQFFM